MVVYEASFLHVVELAVPLPVPGRLHEPSLYDVEPY